MRLSTVSVAVFLVGAARLEMAPFVPLTDGAQVEVVSVLGGIVVTNRLWFTTDDPPITQTSLDGLAVGVYSWYILRVLPFLSVDLQLAAIVAKDWTSDPPPFISVAGPPINGGDTDEAHSANVAVVAPFRWPLNFSKLKRNKNYVPGIPKSAVDVNTVTETFSGNIFEGYAALIDAARLFSPLLTWRWRVTSAWEGNVLRSTQFVRDSIGPPPGQRLKIGQRRKRLS